LASPREEQSLDVLVGNFQTTTVDRAGQLDLVLETPLVFEGVMTEFQFADLLVNWAHEASFQFGRWVFWPPKVQTVDWTEYLQPEMLWGNPLLVPPPDHQSRYLVHRLYGSGAQLPEAARNQLLRSAFALGKGDFEWNRDYLGLAAGSGQTTFLHILMPVPVAVDAFYDAGKKELRIQVFYRPPYAAHEFWLRLGERWNVGLPTEPFSEDAYNEGGWLSATAVRKDVEPDQRLKVWVGTNEAPNEFRWQIAPPITPPRSPRNSREAFLSTWYGLAGQTLAGQLQQTSLPVAPQKRGQLVGPAFELMLANACSALGYAVLIGSAPISTPGVDFLAFQEESGMVLAVSATITNDVAEKVRAWALVEKTLRESLPGWTVRPVIVSAQSADTILGSDRSLAANKGVLVLAREELAPLIEDPPDLAGFEFAFKASIQTIP
jgi:hypothetical protein